MFKVGAIYRYSFLWSRESLAGEVSGRKNRPACLLMRPADRPDILVLFPITSRAAGHLEFGQLIPEAECRRAGIDSPAWIIMDELNLSLASDPYDFASLTPIGEFSPGFRETLLTRAKAALVARRAKITKRSS
jgi:hypothetical protein